MKIATTLFVLLTCFCANPLLAGGPGNGETAATAMTIIVKESKNVTCPGAMDGSITIEISGQTVDPARIVWNDGGTGLERTELTDGIYVATLLAETADEEDVESAPIYISSPSPLRVEPSDDREVVCNGNVELAIKCGTPDYTATWSDDVTGTTRDDLEPGVYTVTVADKDGCTVAVEVPVGAPVLETNDNADNTDFGEVSQRGMPTETFSVANMGFADLVIDQVSVVTTEGDVDFTIEEYTPPTDVARQAFTTFIVRLVPEEDYVGPAKGTVTITSNDCDEPSYEFDLMATVQQARVFRSDDATFHQTITGAIEGIPDGGPRQVVLLIESGTYTEDVDLGSKNVRLRIGKLPAREEN